MREHLGKPPKLPSQPVSGSVTGTLLSLLGNCFIDIPSALQRNRLPALNLAASTARWPIHGPSSCLRDGAAAWGYERLSPPEISINRMHVRVVGRLKRCQVRSGFFSGERDEA
jgi:hypothetical protein